jgi:hypothetical protein
VADPIRAPETADAWRPITIKPDCRSAAISAISPDGRRSRSVLSEQLTVEGAQMSLVSPTADHDDRTRREVYDLHDKEYCVANQYRVDQKQRQRRAPHRESRDAKTGGAALPD